MTDLAQGRACLLGDDQHASATLLWPATVEAAPVVVAFHGLTDGAETFAPLARRLDGQAHLVAVDAPGHGGSTWAPAGRYDYRLHAAAARTVLTRLDEVVAAPSVILMGHSLGSLTALRALIGLPEQVGRKVAHLVLVEPPRRPIWEGRGRRWDRELVARMQTMDVASRMDLMRPRVSWSEADLRVWAQSKQDVDERILKVPSRFGRSVVRDIRQVTTPVTLLLGEVGESEMTRGRLSRLQRSCPTSLRVERLPGAGHSPHREAPEAFAAVLREVVAQARPGSHDSGAFDD